MTKRLAGCALAAAAAVTFALPATPANAAGCLDEPATYVIQCVVGSVSVTDVCIPVGGTYLCLSDFLK